MTQNFPMTTLAGCRVTQTLHEDPKTGIYRAVRDTPDGAENVIVKTLRASHPPLEDVAQLRHEFEIARQLPLAGVVQPLDWLAHENSFVLLTEDFGGVPLPDFLRAHHLNGALDLDLFFAIALDLAATLHEVHAHGVIHKDIKPDNILIHPQTRAVKLGDFGIASRLASEIPTAEAPLKMQGTLSYMSPEQTGRMNQPLDYRSDFYSLGVTFFQMLTGRLPFAATDPMEIVHCHLAVIAPNPGDLRADLPVVVGEIVAETARQNRARTLSERQRFARRFAGVSGAVARQRRHCKFRAGARRPHRRTAHLDPNLWARRRNRHAARRLRARRAGRARTGDDRRLFGHRQNFGRSRNSQTDYQSARLVHRRQVRSVSPRRALHRADRGVS